MKKLSVIHSDFEPENEPFGKEFLSRASALDWSHELITWPISEILEELLKGNGPLTVKDKDEIKGILNDHLRNKYDTQLNKLALSILKSRQEIFKRDGQFPKKNEKEEYEEYQKIKEGVRALIEAVLLMCEG